MFGKLIHFWRGIVRVRIESAHAEQIINAAHRKGIGFWKVKRLDAQTVSMTIREKDLDALSKIAERYFAEIKREFHFSKSVLLSRYKKRWGLFIALGLFTVGFAVLNCFVWDIEVTGCNQKLSEQEVLREFEEMGLRVGRLRFGIDADELENSFLLQNKDAIWVSVNMHFTTASIEVRERTTPLEIYDFSKPCDIYAARDGLIVEMMVKSGTALVKEGDAVVAGQMLISREHTSKYGDVTNVHALGYAKARTTRVISAEVPLKYNEHTPTGQKKKFITLNLFNLKIPLYFNKKISYNNYDKTESESLLKIGRFMALPLGIETETYTEVTISEKTLDQAVAKAEAMGKLEQQEKKQLSAAEIIEKEVKETLTEQTLTLTATYTCVEDIALTMGDK